MTHAVKSRSDRGLAVEAGVMRMGSAIGDGTAPMYFPRMALVVDASSGMVLQFKLGEPADDYVPLLLGVLQGAAEKMGGLPWEVHVRDPKLVPGINEVLGPHGVKVVVRESLPMLDRAFDGLMEPFAGKPEPALLDVPGMSLERFRSYADAAEAFYEARPWRYLTDEDPIEIESPPGPPGVRLTQVLGAAGLTYGLGFVPSLEAHKQLAESGKIPRGGMWNLIFGNIDSVPFDDGQTWEQNGLPVAGPNAYSAFLHWRRSKALCHPAPGQLAWAEGLLRALAATTEDEIDRGRWEKHVETFDGPATYKLSLPLLLEQMRRPAPVGRASMEPILRDVQRQFEARGPMSDAEAEAFAASFRGRNLADFVPANDVERAQALSYQAFESTGRRKVQLARQALALDPDCVDALSILAEHASDPESALPIFRRAVEAGERQLGPQRMIENAGHFWGIIETRPYMRAREQLAATLMRLRRYDEAAGHLQDLLRLNPNDNQGSRNELARCLLHSNRDDDLERLLNDPLYRDDASPAWAFTGALLAFRRAGDSPEARRQLAEAVGRNRFVAPILSGRKPPAPYPPNAYLPGDENEAQHCASQIFEEWGATPGAIEWLDSTWKTANRRRDRWNLEGDKKKRKRR